MKTLKLDVLKIVFVIGLGVILLLKLAGCGDAGITNTAANNGTGNDNATLSIKADDTVLDNDVIIITEAKALITEVEFELEGSEIEHELHGPAFVIHFDINGGIQQVLTGNIPEGTYDKIKFKIHKPEDNEMIPDPEFREGSSGNLRYSFIIKGTFNGSSFVYKSKKSANLVINFNSPVNFAAGSKNLTVLFNQIQWFKNGNVILDPRNSQHENEIDDNLKNSFKRAFKDDDKDGRPDN